ncbi:unnamed protein product [Heligmosomoides polygyrus]|uniref:Selenocysteine lyase n=1 Tax=Heligmosomoides polygyrus TaxID=6339 RepID=A0A183F2Q4_HELPZ|nr:unnamed protein product [Heligmosomoides polygyrus]
MSWYIEEQEPVYLDYNATTPLDSTVKKAIAEGLELWANPSSKTPLALKAKEAIEKAKRSLGELLHVSDAEVVFTSGGTEANNWVIYSAIESFKSASQRCSDVPHVISSTIEHPSILEPLRHLRDNGSIELSLLPVDPTSGQVVPSDLEKFVSPSTCLLTVMLANNETGVLQPIPELSVAARRASKKHGNSIFVHSDASQAVGKLDVNIAELKVDAITVAGHKFYGPRNGALVVRSQYATQILPMLRGGGQERGLRSGTENTPVIMGLGAAAATFSPKVEAHLRDIRDYFEQRLHELVPEEHVVHFQHSPRLPNTSSVAFPKYPKPSPDLVAKYVTSSAMISHLVIVTVETECASTSSAASSYAFLSSWFSAVLLACGIPKEVAERTVRFSFGRETTKDDVDRVVKELKAILFLAKHGSSLMNVINKGPVPGF